MAKPWFSSRPAERGGGFDVVSWQGAAVLAVYCLLIAIAVASIVASDGSVSSLIAAATLCIGGSYWLVRVIRAHGEPDA